MDRSNAALILDFMQVGGHNLTQGEYRTTLFVLNFILGWDKYTDEIPLHRFINGHCGRNGVAYQSGCGLSKRTVQSALKSLTEEYEFFEISVGKNNVHVFTVLVENIKKYLKMTKLKISKKFNKIRKEQGGVQNSTGGGCKTAQTPYPMSNIPYVPSSSLHSEEGDALPAESASTVASRIRTKHQELRDEKIKALATERPSRSNLVLAYQSAYKKHHDGSPDPKISPREWGNYKHFVQNTKFPEDFDYSAFFEETVKYWPNLMTGPFRWVRGSPARPTLAYICKLIRKLYEYFINSRQGGEKYSLCRRFVPEEVHKKVFEDVCKEKEKLKEQLDRAKEFTPDKQAVRDAKIMARDFRDAIAVRDTMSKRIDHLLMENARLRSRNPREEDELPNFSEVTLAKSRKPSSSPSPTRRRRTVPVAPRA